MGHQPRKYVSPEEMLRMAHTVLETPLWPERLEPMRPYLRLHDDHDGTNDGVLEVVVAPNGDAHVRTMIDPASRTTLLRFRTREGGGHSPRVHNALVLLALAIELDNEEGK